MEHQDPWAAEKARHTLEVDGAEFVYTRYGAWRFRIARLCDWNDKYAQALARLMVLPKYRSTYARAGREGYEETERDKTLTQEYLLEAFVDGCLLGWSGVPAPIEPGMLPREYQFNRANAIELLSTFHELYHKLDVFARNASNYEGYPGEDAVMGNLPVTSDTSMEDTPKRSQDSSMPTDSGQRTPPAPSEDHAGSTTGPGTSGDPSSS